ncbi:MAG: permease, partial [Planctomycetota bacterium]
IPLLELLHQPLIGWTALAIILATLVARLELPLKIPGALGALLVAGSLYYVLKWAGFDWQETAEGIDPATGLWPYEWLEVWRFPWLSAIPATMPYLPIVIPFALATVVGGIDCAESAAAVGDEYDTRAVVGVEAIASIVAALCGGIVQTTPYIGHPAYKAMGVRSAYTLATALFVGAAGLIGFFGYLYVVIPKATVLPILVFVGLEITAQSFHATPVRHFPAVALACVPALATLVQIYVEKLTGVFVAPGTVAKFPPALAAELQTIRLLANGFVITSLCWASLLAALIYRQLRRASACAALAAVATLFGIMHSPLPGNPLVWPGSLPPDAAAATWSLALSYAVVAVLFLVGSVITKQVPRPE